MVILTIVILNYSKSYKCISVQIILTVMTTPAAELIIITLVLVRVNSYVANTDNGISSDDIRNSNYTNYH